MRKIRLCHVALVVSALALSLAPRGQSVDVATLRMALRAEVEAAIIRSARREEGPRPRPRRTPAPVAVEAPVRPPSPLARPDLHPYESLASWVDIYDRQPWAHPVATVRALARRGVRTLFLQTSNYGARYPIYRREATAAFIDTAHRQGVKVVAWSVPSFARREEDFERVMRAINFRTPAGRGFDSFALDIEATVVGDVARRNQRFFHLARRIRRTVGDAYALGAIVPDPQASRYWPEFPYRRAARYFDVIMPMGYFTYRTSGPRRVFHYTADNIRFIRRRVGRRVPIHMIGGIASDAAPEDVKGFVRASRKHKAVGASLYDYPITGRSKWEEMKPARAFGAS